MDAGRASAGVLGDSDVFEDLAKTQVWGGGRDWGGGLWFVILGSMGRVGANSRGFVPLILGVGMEWSGRARVNVASIGRGLKTLP